MPRGRRQADHGRGRPSSAPTTSSTSRSPAAPPSPTRPARRRASPTPAGRSRKITAERERAEVEAWAEHHRLEAEREQAELAAAAEKRHEFIGRLIRGKHNKKDALTLLLTDYIAWCLDAGWSQRAVQFLGLDVTDEGDTFDAITTYAGQSLANLTRAALALRMDEIESRVQGFVAFLDGDVRKHYAFLIDNGYEPSEIEKRGIDEAKATRAADEQADDEQADDEQAEVDPSDVEPSEVEPSEVEPSEAEQDETARRATPRSERGLAEGPGGAIRPALRYARTSTAPSRERADSPSYARTARYGARPREASGMVTGE